jgi:hypothetical protein
MCAAASPAQAFVDGLCAESLLEEVDDGESHASKSGYLAGGRHHNPSSDGIARGDGI